jgi:hypothetical protein
LTERGFRGESWLKSGLIPTRYGIGRFASNVSIKLGRIGIRDAIGGKFSMAIEAKFFSRPNSSRLWTPPARPCTLIEQRFGVTMSLRKEREF